MFSFCFLIILFSNYFSQNIIHISEKNCKIKDKVAKGEIPQIAYENYLKLLEEVERY